MKNLNNKVVIITGSSQGIGKATAKLFLEKGALVMLNGRNEQKLMSTYNELKELGTVAYFCGDMTQQKDVQSLLAETLNAFGRLDVLINNVGVSMRGDFGELSPEVFTKVFGLNIIGKITPSILALPELRKTKGSLVFISSLAAVKGLPGLSAYSGSKMALRGIADSIRFEELNNGIHVGVVYVGMTQNEPDKTTIDHKGERITLEDRSQGKALTMDQTANEIFNNVAKRRFITVSTPLGKLLYILQRIFPWLVEKIIFANLKKLEKGSR